MASATRGRSFSVGGVLEKSFPIWFKNLVPFAILSLVVYSPLIVYTYVAHASEMDHAAAVRYNLISTFGGHLLNLITGGALLYGVFQQLRGQPAGIGTCLAVGLSRMLAVLVVGILVGVLVLLGLCLFVVPGVFLALMYWVAVPVAVVEKPGVFAALTRSAQLTKGERGNIFLIQLVLQAIGLGIGIVVGIALASADEATSAWVMLAVTIVLGSLGATMNAVGYHDLRVAKDGVGVEELVRVFE
jgi:hypothetical protein